MAREDIIKDIQYWIGVKNYIMHQPLDYNKVQDVLKLIVEKLDNLEKMYQFMFDDNSFDWRSL